MDGCHGNQRRPRPQFADGECKKHGGSANQNARDAHVVHTEPDPKGLKVGIDVRNLRKDYESGSCACLRRKRKEGPAVDGLSFKAYENQITSFLGHNGAGAFLVGRG
jgi:ABC-type glutathione transport system ATPase component